MARGRNHAVGALLASKARILLDTVNGKFGGAPEHGKYRAIFQEIDGVVAPFTRGDLAAVETENAVKLAPAEGYLGCGGGRAYLAPAPRARLDFAECHAAPPSLRWKLVSLKLHCHDRA